MAVSARDVCSSTGANPGKVRVTLNRATGAFTGSYVPAAGGTPRSFTGVQDLKANQAAGVFIDGPATGAVLFVPQ